MTTTAQESRIDGDFKVIVRHHEDRHMVAIYVVRGDQSLIGPDQWATVDAVRGALPLCWMPCIVWDRITDGVKAHTMIHLADSIAHQIEAYIDLESFEFQGF